MISLFAAAVIALAGPPRSPPFLMPAGQEAYAGWLENAARHLPETFGWGACSNGKVESVGAYPVKGPNGRPAYAEKVRITGCGEAQIYNFVVSNNGMGWESAPIMPGETMAGPQLVRDSIRLAIPAALASPPALPCDPKTSGVKVGEGRLLTPYKDGQPWSERWVFVACGVERPVILKFTPTAYDGGTDISVTADFKP